MITFRTRSREHLYIWTLGAFARCGTVVRPMGRNVWASFVKIYPIWADGRRWLEYVCEIMISIIPCQDHDVAFPFDGPFPLELLMRILQKS